MRIKYHEAIRESDAELAALERQLAGQRSAVRVRMLRLLKSESVPSLRACAVSLGYSVPQVNRWWDAYKQHGLAGMTGMKPRLGKQPWVSPQVWAALKAELQAGRIVRLEDARTYLKEQWSIEYRSASGVWQVFKQRGVKLEKGQTRQWQVDEDTGTHQTTAIATAPTASPQA